MNANQAYRLAEAEARKARWTTFVLVETRDDWGKPTVEFCPEDAADILYGVQLKHGLARLIGSLRWSQMAKQVTGNIILKHGTLFPIPDDPKEDSEGMRMARSELAGLMGQD